ncbi:hypothetical protein TI39_contig840g00009 [Zymoseptoria brevis]|uniref:Uncharacterized protein n=1 Tax=Zymoseptoria brevis TaxID=1047168 RepID=A0A0F4GFH2_9PEZI|nr:hypothetical protein TI39_contig840g00009 [Zymoseptoria brevis]
MPLIRMIESCPGEWTAESAARFLVDIAKRAWEGRNADVSDEDATERFDPTLDFSEFDGRKHDALNAVAEGSDRVLKCRRLHQLPLSDNEDEAELGEASKSAGHTQIGSEPPHQYFDSLELLRRGFHHMPQRTDVDLKRTDILYFGNVLRIPEKYLLAQTWPRHLERTKQMGGERNHPSAG